MHAVSSLGTQVSGSWTASMMALGAPHRQSEAWGPRRVHRGWTFPRVCDL